MTLLDQLVAVGGTADVPEPRELVAVLVPSKARVTITNAGRNIVVGAGTAVAYPEDPDDKVPVLLGPVSVVTSPANQLVTLIFERGN